MAKVRKVNSSIWVGPGDPAPKDVLVIAPSIVETDPDQVVFDGVMVETGRFVWTFPEGYYPGQGVNGTVYARGYKSQAVRFNSGLDGQANEGPQIVLEPSDVPFPRLVADGNFWRRVDGSRWTTIGANDFNILNRLLRGEDIDPILDQRAAIGFNTGHAWTAFNVCPDGTWPDGTPCQAIGRLNPREHSDFYDRGIPDLAYKYRQRGMMLEFTAFTGRDFFANDSQFVEHWERLNAACAGIPNVRVEAQNEYDNAANAGVPLDLLRRPVGVLASHGSSVWGGDRKTPDWDYAMTTPGGTDFRKIGHGCMAAYLSVPTEGHEPSRCPDRANVPQQFEDCGQVAALLCAGVWFHSVGGKNSVMFGQVEEDCGSALVRGAKSIDLAFQDGKYRNNENPPPGIFRDYIRQLPDGREAHAYIHGGDM